MLYWNLLFKSVITSYSISRTETNVVLKLLIVILYQIKCEESNRNKCCIEIQTENSRRKKFIVEPKQMLYWNATFLKWRAPMQNGRTETNVVLKFDRRLIFEEFLLRRTETNVVLKWRKKTKNKSNNTVEPKQMLYWNSLFVLLPINSK